MARLKILRAAFHDPEECGAGSPDIAPTPKPAIKRPIVICGTERSVPVWMATPTVKIADQRRIDPLRPKRSAVNACPRAPLRKRIREKVEVGEFQVRTKMFYHAGVSTVIGSQGVGDVQHTQQTAER
jgi:hypothetical protein